MKISIGPLKIHITIGTHHAAANEPIQEQPDLFSTGIATYRSLYNEKADQLVLRIQQIEQASASSSYSINQKNRIALIVEEVLPPPKTEQEAAYHNFIRYCLVTNSNQDLQVTNVVQQLLLLLHIPKEPYQLPKLQPLSLETVMLPMAKLGASFVGKDVLDTPIDQRPIDLSSPFVDYLKGRQIVSYTETLIDKVKSEFDPKSADWVHNCEIIQQLTLSLLGLQHLKHPSLLFEGELKEAIHDTVEQLPGVMKKLSEMLQELENHILPGSGGLRFSQLIAYRDFSNRHFNTSQHSKNNQDNVLHFSRDLNGHAHSISIDPKNQRFFVHLKKKGMYQKAILVNRDYTLHKALMVTGNQLNLINDTVWKENSLIMHDIRIREIFRSCPQIVNPPIAITHYSGKSNLPSQAANSSSQNPISSELNPKKTALLEDSYDTNLSAWIEMERTGTALPEILDIFYDVAQGMHRLHINHALHGDINPENIQIKYETSDDTTLIRSVLGNLRYVRPVGRRGKLKPTQARTKEGNRIYTANGNPVLIKPKFMGNELYTPPECSESMKESQSLAGDIWAFGISLWQCMYGKNQTDFPFPLDPEISISTQIGELTQYYLTKSLKKKMPTPKTLQEACIQRLINRCLKTSPHLRLNSEELLNELLSIKQTPPDPYIPTTTSEQNIQELFQPFTEFEERMGQRSGGAVVRSCRRVKSLVTLPGQALGSRSLPPELFKVFSKQGKLREHLDEVDKLIRRFFLSKTQPLGEIENAWNALIRTRRVIEKLKGLIDKFQPSHADLLIQHRENLKESSFRLKKQKKKLENSIVANSGGLTYIQIKNYQEFLQKKIKIHKNSHGTMGEGSYVRPIAFHFPKNSEPYLDHAVSLDPLSASLFIHLKKTGSKHRELGKGAVKSVHPSTCIQSNSLSKCADSVTRLDDYDDQEEQLKLLFKNCPYIEDSAEVIALYSKEEIPNLWKSKKKLKPAEIDKIKQEHQPVNVEKLAFFSPLYQPFGKFSYRSGANRNIPLIVKLLTDVAKGLSVMHAHGYIHRDIKPGNLLVKKMYIDGKKTLIGVLADLGEATPVAENGIIPLGVTMAGTMHYNAPENCVDENCPSYCRQSFTSDIWAFGILMCQSLYGEHGRDLPFIDNDSQLHIFAQLASLTQETIEQALTERFPEPASPSEERAQIAIRECLRLDPSQRPNAEELAVLLSPPNAP